MGDVAAEANLTIDELATSTGVSSRTIRFYQGAGALMPPEKRGRVAYYGPAHAERLDLIAQLADRGLKIDAIATLMKRMETGEVDVAEWLGVEADLAQPWSSDHARTMTEAELYDFIGSKRPGTLADLMRTGVVERKGEVYFIASPSLLLIALKLQSVGIDITTAVEASDVLRKHLGRAVDELVDLFVGLFEEGRLEIGNSGLALAVFRSAGVDAVRLLFTRAMEKQLRTLIDSGKLATVTARAKKKRKKRGQE